MEYCVYWRKENKVYNKVYNLQDMSQIVDNQMGNDFTYKNKSRRKNKFFSLKSSFSKNSSLKIYQNLIFEFE